MLTDLEAIQLFSQQLITGMGYARQTFQALQSLYMCQITAPINL